MPLFPDERQKTTEELFAEMNGRCNCPGWTNAFTMPIKNRLDMLTTGIRTPVGVKIFGTDLDEIERAGEELEQLLSTVPGTRSAFYERSQGGLYVDIVPDRDALARYGMTVGTSTTWWRQPSVASRSRRPSRAATASASTSAIRGTSAATWRGSWRARSIRMSTGRQVLEMGDMEDGFDLSRLLTGPYALAQADMGSMSIDTRGHDGAWGAEVAGAPPRTWLR